MKFFLPKSLSSRWILVSFSMKTCLLGFPSSVFLFSTSLLDTKWFDRGESILFMGSEESEFFFLELFQIKDFLVSLETGEIIDKVFRLVDFEI